MCRRRTTEAQSEACIIDAPLRGSADYLKFLPFSGTEPAQKQYGTDKPITAHCGRYADHPCIQPDSQDDRQYKADDYGGGDCGIHRIQVLNVESRGFGAVCLPAYLVAQIVQPVQPPLLEMNLIQRLVALLL